MLRSFAHVGTFIITKNRHGADDGFLVYVATQLLSVLRVPPRL